MWGWGGGRVCGVGAGCGGRVRGWGGVVDMGRGTRTV